MIEWPKKFIHWTGHLTKRLFISIPFTWELPAVRKFLLADRPPLAIVGGPGILLMPWFFNDLSFVVVGDSMPGILQRINPQATRTTVGCIRKCTFCGIGSGLIERGPFKELPDWPDLPIICDNNLLAASIPHFDRVIERLVRWGWADFNQGLDARLLTKHHADQIGRIKGAVVRLALDHSQDQDRWMGAFELLRSAGVAKKRIRTYCLIGFDSDPQEAWDRCEWVQAKPRNIKALPMWFHGLTQLKKNEVTEDQEELGWTDNHRKAIMQWYYKHKRRAVGFLDPR